LVGREGRRREGEFGEEEGEGLGCDVGVGGTEGGKARECDVVRDGNGEIRRGRGDSEILEVGVGAVEGSEEGGEVGFLGEQRGGGQGGVGGVAYG